MNCADFNERLLEYVDESLPAEVQAAAREHLCQCADCRRALVREQALADSIRHSLDRATAGLSLRPNAQQRILRALESAAPPATPMARAWQWLLSIPLRPVAAAVALLLLLFLLRGIPFHPRTAPGSAPQAAAQAALAATVIDLPMQTQIHYFRWEANTVVDMIVPGDAVASAQFLQNKETPSQKL
jgi:anti-sigma factor RsiW